MLYTRLRPNRNVRLISYPYYTKYASERDNTHFSQIGIYVPRHRELVGAETMFETQREPKVVCFRELSIENKSPDRGHWLAVLGIEKLMRVLQPYAKLDQLAQSDRRFSGDSSTQFCLAVDIHYYDDKVSAGCDSRDCSNPLPGLYISELDRARRY